MTEKPHIISFIINGNVYEINPQSIDDVLSKLEELVSRINKIEKIIDLNE